MIVRVTMLLSGTILMMAVSASSAELFFGETSLQSRYDNASVILRGTVLTRHTTVVHSAKARTRCDVLVLETLKGSNIIERIAVTLISHSSSTTYDRVRVGESFIFFLTKELATTDPWFSVHPDDPSLVWALRELRRESPDAGGEHFPPPSAPVR
jgi:hypothetical protein